MPTATRSRTRLDPGARREQIVAAAEAVFSGRDPADVTFEQVAEAAGVSRALLYNYFGDKGGLVAAVYLRCYQRLDDELARAVNDIAPGAARLRAIIRAYLVFASDNADAYMLISMAEANFHPLVRGARRQRLDRMTASWEDADDARLLARGILGFLESATLDWLESPDTDADRAEDVLFALLWSGLSGLRGHGIELPAR